MKNLTSLFIIATSLVVTTGIQAYAQSAQEKGLAIAKELDRRDLGWQDSTATLKMVLKNRQGQSSSRELRTLSFEVNETGLGDRSMTIFDRPGDIRGTALLSYTKILKPDDQWLFLPAIKRVKRISSSNKSGPFVGSEFAYEDLLSNEVARYSYKWIKDVNCGKLTCFKVERYPAYKNSGYTRQVVWIDQKEYRILRVDYYDRKKSLLKTLKLNKYRQYLGKHWRALKMQMKNHQTGKSTTLTFSGYKFKTGMVEGDFTPAKLKRAR